MRKFVLGKLTWIMFASAIMFTMSSQQALAQDVDPVVDTFVNALWRGDREIAASMADGVVTQVSGTGPMLHGGPHNGLWNKRIVDGKDSLSVADAFETFVSCQFDRAGRPNGVTSKKSVWISYGCPVATAIVFHVRPSETTGKVSVFDLGRYLITPEGIIK